MELSYLRYSKGHDMKVKILLIIFLINIFNPILSYSAWEDRACFATVASIPYTGGYAVVDACQSLEIDEEAPSYECTSRTGTLYQSRKVLIFRTYYYDTSTNQWVLHGSSGQIGFKTSLVSDLTAVQSITSGAELTETLPESCGQTCEELKDTYAGEFDNVGKHIYYSCLDGCEVSIAYTPEGQGNNVCGTVKNSNDVWVTFGSGYYTGNQCGPGTGDAGEPQQPKPCSEYQEQCESMCLGQVSQYECPSDSTGEGRVCECVGEVPPLIDLGDGSGWQPDTDKDGEPNGTDNDIDNDGKSNGSDDDTDGDGKTNKNDSDNDNDGTSNGGNKGWGANRGNPTGLGADPDVDGDGNENGYDDDIDGDGISNGNDPGIDGDGVPNHLDQDADGDGIPNGEDSDADGDGVPNGDDTDSIGVTSSTGDSDGDGVNEGSGEGNGEDDGEGTGEGGGDGKYTAGDKCPEGQICIGDGVCQAGEPETSIDCATANYFQERFQTFQGEIQESAPFKAVQQLEIPSGGSPVWSYDFGNWGGVKTFDFSEFPTILLILKSIVLLSFSWLGIRIITLKR